MMKSYLSSFCAALLIYLVTSPPVFAGHHGKYDKADAISDCEHRIADHDSYNQFTQTKVDHPSKQVYKVTGKVKKLNQSDDKFRAFRCEVHHGEVAHYSVDKPGNSGDGSTALAVGAGVLGLAVLAAVAGSDKDGHKPKDFRNDHPFADSGTLRRRCERELTRHLNQGHGQVSKLTFEQSRLHDRDLKGRAKVRWKGGSSSEIDFDCKFDRSARIYDGTYRYHSNNSADQDCHGSMAHLYYRDGWKMGGVDAHSHRKANYRRYYTDNDHRYESCYRNGYSVGYKTGSENAKSHKHKSLNHAKMDSNQRAYYDDGYRAGAGDGRAHMSMAYERHRKAYDSRFKPYFAAGYEDGWKAHRYD